MLVLWQKTEWKTENKLYYSIIGTPLSGGNISKYYDIESKTFGSERFYNGKLGFGALVWPALNYLQHGTLGCKSCFCNFCGSVPARKTSKLNIYDLIQYLKSK